MTFRLKNPPHPGAFVKSEIIEGHELTVTDGAKALGVTRQALSELTNCRTALSADMALRLETVFGVSMDTLLRMQTSYEIAQARQRGTSTDLKPYKPTPKTIEAGQQPFDDLTGAPEPGGGMSGFANRLSGMLAGVLA